MTEQEFFKDIGAKIKALRKKAKMTQKEVASKADVYQTDLSSLENGVDKIKSIDRLRKIVEATGHSMTDLFQEPEKKTHFTTSSAGSLCPP